MDDATRFEFSRILGQQEVWNQALQGQIEAIRCALFAALQFVQANEEFRAHMESNLASRLKAMTQGNDPPAVKAGYESAMRELLSGVALSQDTDPTAH